MPTFVFPPMILAVLPFSSPNSPAAAGLFFWRYIELVFGYIAELVFGFSIYGENVCGNFAVAIWCGVWYIIFVPWGVR